MTLHPDVRGRKEPPGGGGRDKGDGIGGIGFRSGGRGGRGGQGGGRGGYAGAKKQEEFGGGGKKEVARGFNAGGVRANPMSCPSHYMDRQ